MNVFELFASLSLDKSKYDSELAGAEKAGKSAGETIGNAMKVVAGATIAGVTAAASAVGVLVKNSTEAYAEFEQLAGGTALLFGTNGQTLQEYAQSQGKTMDEVKSAYITLLDAQTMVMENAKNAYKTVQMSQNEYLTQVNGFAVGLKTSLGGNSEAAADLAHKIVTAEADIVAATGNSQEAVQNAFNGIMKSNYTMLDNLQLGITPTKEGMQEVIDKVNAWNKANGEATKYQMGNLADMQAALVDYVEMQGMAGYASKEAMGTITGSLAATKAAWANLMTGLADENANFDELIGSLVESATAFGGNIIPRIEQALSGVGQLINNMLPVVLAEVPTLINDMLPQFLSSGKDLLLTIVTGIKDNSQTLIDGAKDVFTLLVDAAFEIAPELIKAGFDIIKQLAQGIIDGIPLLLERFKEIVAQGATLASKIATKIRENLPVLIQTVLTIAQDIASTLAEQAPILLEAGIEILMAIVDGLIEALPIMIEQLPVIIDTLANIINDNMPRIIEAGFQIIVAIGQGIINAVPVLIQNFPMIIKAIIDVWSAVNWLQLGANVITGIKNGIMGLIGLVKQAGSNIGTAIVDAVKHLPQTLAGLGGGSIRSFISSIKNLIPNLLETAGYMMLDLLVKFESFSLVDVGKNLIKGLIDGIFGMAGELLSTVGGIMTNVITTASNIFDQHSPSKVFRKIGEYNVEGFMQGMQELDANKAVLRFNDVVDAVNNVEPVKVQSTAEKAEKAATNATNTNVTVVLEGDAKRLFKIMQQQAREEEQLTGKPAFA